MRQFKFLIVFVLSILLLTGCSTTTQIDTTNTTTQEVSTTTTNTPPTTISTTTSTVITTTTTVSTTTSTTTVPTTVTTTTTAAPLAQIGQISGLDDVLVIRNHYFHPLKGVRILSTLGSDITHLVQISGHVSYGVLGTYSLVYSLQYNDDFHTQTRMVQVIDGTYLPPVGTRPSGGMTIIDIASGSYRSASLPTIAHPATPAFIENDLLAYAIPSNGWWTSLLVQNYGGSNGIYTNPLRSSFANQGVEITHSGDGFVQYWNPENYQTIAQFSLALKDMYLKSSDLASGYVTRVIDYSDFGVKVAMRNNLNPLDHMVITYAQGSPYIFAEVANKNSPFFTMGTDGVDNYEYYRLDGTRITTSTYQGSAIIVRMVRRHVGYTTSPPANVGSPIYADRFFLVNTPENTTFTISSGGHPFGLLNRVSMQLGDGNYLSVASINSLSEAAFYHEHGYAIVSRTNTSFQIDHLQSLVTTDYHVSAQLLRSDKSAEPAIALMPHHYKNSSAILSNYQFRTVRGTLKVMTDTHFSTNLSFHGMLPSFTLPTAASFDNSLILDYLGVLIAETDPSDPMNFYNDEGPYWNSKALYPLSQGIIIADQLGNTTLRDELIERLKALLVDWYSYINSADLKFLYYNQTWGSVYYSNNDFNTASELSDHAFTHGYLIYASSILAMYDSTFIEEYGQVVDLLVNDYLFTEKQSSDFAYLRSFDSWAGHSWAHGFGTFAEGNNLESTGEALNSWVGGYLWGLANNDTSRVNAAIYGFVTELSAVKEYWFDYDQTNWNKAYSDYAAVAGMVWGGKFDYATWFGANPTFIYGIQWLPTGEYLTNYALDDFEYSRLQFIFQRYLQAKNNQIDTWYSNMWTIQAILNPQTAISMFNASKIINDDYPAELPGAYWMIHALESLGRRTSSIWMEVHPQVASSIYQHVNGEIQAMVWNPSNESQEVLFLNVDGVVKVQTVPAKSFTRIILNPSS
ncbi:MAG: glycosyl hydrolase [bacterium]|nr:glycosyl hydrolase [bacterium]